jgi:hypothetical protein
MERILRIAEPTTQGPPDLTLATYDPLSPVLPEGPAMLFLQDPAGKTLKPLPGMAVSENHPLMTDLDWRGLIVRDSFQVPFKPHDAPLLWVGERPVIFLRNAGGAPQLIFNFDVASSNASQLPAFALLLHRFLEERRSEKPAFAAANVTTGETLPLPGRERAPLVPGFFTIPGKDGTPRFEGAAQFGDARESNLLEATSGELDSAQSESIRLFNAEGQRFDSLWLLLLGLLMIWNWWLTGSLPSQKIAQTVPRPNI